MKQHSYACRLFIFLFTLVSLTFIAYACDGGSSSSSSSSGGCDGGSSSSNSSSSGGNGSCQSPTPVTPSNIGTAPTGPYKVVIEHDAGLLTHTIYRPVVNDAKMPIIVWGNGGCLQSALLYEEVLTEWASHGFLIIADGQPTTETGCGEITQSNQDGTALRQGIDWAFKVNELSCSQYYHKLDTSKVAAMGQSCGGLMTLNVGDDPRLTTIVAWNSGLMQSDPAVYSSLHAPMAFFVGGESDVAYENALRDFDGINNVPVFFGSLDVGHQGTYNEDNGGEFGRVGTAWLKWRLHGNTGPNGAAMFVGSNCGLCNSDWMIKKKNME